MGKIGIVIVNYKNYAERFLSDCVESLRKQEADNLSWRLYIVDNASSENSREYLKKYAPEARVIARPDGNYSAANNSGIQKAREDGCDYFVIANMDVVFAPGWLKELATAVNSDKKAGIAQSKILLWPKEKNKINSAGNIIHFLGFGYTLGHGERDRGQYDKKKEIKGYASGCSFIIKKEVIEKIGDYNEEYYMYHDDTEMGWRAKLAGYKIVFASKSSIYHKYEFSRSVKMLYYMERNRYLNIFSFYKLPTIFLIFLPLIIMELGLLSYSVLIKNFKNKLKIYYYFLKPGTWRKIIKTRNSVKKYRQVSDREMSKNISGIIEFQEIMNPVLKYAVNPLFNVYWSIARKFIWW